MPIVDEMRVKDQEAAVRALFGSWENYINSPILKEVNDRIVYLEKMKRTMVTALSDSRGQIPWWNLIMLGKFWFLRRFFIPMFEKKIDEFILHYKIMRPLPVKFFVNERNKEVDEFYNKQKELFKLINMEPYSNDH